MANNTTLLIDDPAEYAEATNTHLTHYGMFLSRRESRELLSPRGTLVRKFGLCSPRGNRVGTIEKKRAGWIVRLSEDSGAVAVASHPDSALTSGHNSKATSEASKEPFRDVDENELHDQQDNRPEKQQKTGDEQDDDGDPVPVSRPPENRGVSKNALREARERTERVTVEIGKQPRLVRNIANEGKFAGDDQVRDLASWFGTADKEALTAELLGLAEAAEGRGDGDAAYRHIVRSHEKAASRLGFQDVDDFRSVAIAVGADLLRTDDAEQAIQKVRELIHNYSARNGADLLRKVPRSNLPAKAKFTRRDKSNNDTNFIRPPAAGAQKDFHGQISNPREARQQLKEIGVQSMRGRGGPNAKTVVTRMPMSQLHEKLTDAGWELVIGDEKSNARVFGYANGSDRIEATFGILPGNKGAEIVMSKGAKKMSLSKKRARKSQSEQRQPKRLSLASCDITEFTEANNLSVTHYGVKRSPNEVRELLSPGGASVKHFGLINSDGDAVGDMRATTSGQWMVRLSHEELSYDDITQLLMTKLRERFGVASHESPGPISGPVPWIVSTFADHFIYETNGKLFRLEYIRTDNDKDVEITGNPIEVKRVTTFEPVNSDTEIAEIVNKEGEVTGMALRMNFDESKIKRSEDGKFSSNGSGGGQKDGGQKNGGKKPDRSSFDKGMRKNLENIESALDLATDTGDPEDVREAASQLAEKLNGPLARTAQQAVDQVDFGNTDKALQMMKAMRNNTAKQIKSSGGGGGSKGEKEGSSSVTGRKGRVAKNLAKFAKKELDPESGVKGAKEFVMEMLGENDMLDDFSPEEVSAIARDIVQERTR